MKLCLGGGSREPRRSLQYGRGSVFRAHVVLMHEKCKLNWCNDIPRPSAGVHLALFADDTALCLRNATDCNISPHLQRAIDELSRWFQTYRIEVNPEKSSAISFTYRKGRSSMVVARGTPSLRIYNAPIPWQHLGVTLDRNLHFRDHIKRVRKTATYYLARHKGVLDRKSKLSLRNKRTIYLMCIRTVMTYASPVYAHAAPNRLKKLQILQNKFCRSATNTHCDSLCREDPLKGSSTWQVYAPSTPSRVVRPRKVKLNRLAANSIADSVMFCRGTFLVGFNPTLPTRTGARVCEIGIFYLFLVARGEKKKFIYLSCTPTAIREAQL
ncbi:Probable RNA-directed DNA polymerase from transposon BS [Eumeta japonica]|uniref:Probable RNA-directed DNA polymerase from transposon BS n=1 Tax=Eumeta variegata TaxID=151549 RepID=A0A4C1U8X0_EUMVA|nr:Probable RNA-directed DNA polymerase from transposon BS [Eumeta japonica]